MDADFLARIEHHARANAICRSAAVRSLAARALDGIERLGGDADPVGMAALIAAEHALLLIATLLPEGERLSAELHGRALLAADARLALVSGTASEAPE